MIPLADYQKTVRELAGASKTLLAVAGLRSIDTVT